MREIQLNDMCEYDECDKTAKELVYSRNKEKVMKCCWVHANIVVDERSPEYTDFCENCGCMIPVN